MFLVEELNIQSVLATLKRKPPARLQCTQDCGRVWHAVLIRADAAQVDEQCYSGRVQRLDIGRVAPTQNAPQADALVAERPMKRPQSHERLVATIYSPR